MRSLLEGMRVLLVEDEALIAMDLEATLWEAGCIVLGPIARVGQALAAVEGGGFDAALLDVNLNGEKVFPVADALAERKISFLFLTGYEKSILPERYHRCPILRKPCSPRILISALQASIDRC